MIGPSEDGTRMEVEGGENKERKGLVWGREEQRERGRQEQKEEENLEPIQKKTKQNLACLRRCLSHLRG